MAGISADLIRRWGNFPAVENKEEPVIEALADHRAVVDPVEPGALPGEPFHVPRAHPFFELGEGAERLVVLSLADGHEEGLVAKDSA